MAPLGATLMPGSVTSAPGMGTGVMNGPDAPAGVVPPNGAAARAARTAATAMAALRLQSLLTGRERGWRRKLAPFFPDMPFQFDGTRARSSLLMGSRVLAHDGPHPSFGSGWRAANDSSLQRTKTLH